MSSAELNALRWRCRRGMLELDALLQSFLADGYQALALIERAAFHRLLERDDIELYAWLTGREPPPADLRFVVEKLRSCKVKRL